MSLALRAAGGYASRPIKPGGAAASVLRTFTDIIPAGWVLTCVGFLMLGARVLTPTTKNRSEPVRADREVMPEAGSAVPGEW